MLFLTLITSISPTSSNDIQNPLTVCTSLKSGKQFISKTGECNGRIYEARDWYRQGAVPVGTPGSKLIALNLCTSIKSQIRLIREKCNARTQYSHTYQRSYGPPAAPLVPSATADLLGSAFLSFTAPEVDGGALISSYTITSNPGAITSIIASKDIDRAKITGLTPGVTYTFSITATNSQGESLASPSSEAMLAPNLPDAPSITSLILNGDNSARLHYDHTTFDGGAAISSYKATITSSGLVVATRQISPGVLELTGLPYSTTLSISLSARNVAGSSIASNPSNYITTATPPPPPEPEPSPTSSSSAAPSLAAPAFTLSSSTEDVTVNTAATGFTITSTGGVIASFAISPAAPSGMSFNTSTGGFSGTPTATQSATTYTITATNATGSTTQTFSFTVSAAVISIAAIGGVTAPVKDATPVATVTAANGYTGVVEWSGSPTTFAASTTYTATITLTADDGYTLIGVSENYFTVAGATSVTHSANSGVITAVFPATAPSAPAFTLSSSTEDVTVNTAATGFTITSTGGVIASFAISPAAPSGMSFNTSTGGFSGTPTATQSATTYTITATNATGSTTQTFSFTVSAEVTYAVGDTGPGGGTIIYYSASGFNCGPDFSATGSPTGEKCKYLEVAPTGWNGLASDSITVWGNVNVNISGIQDDISVYNNALAVGLGYRNSELIVAQNGTYDASSNKYAAGEARAYAGGGKNDWYLPTSAELNLMCQWAKNIPPDVAVRCSGGSPAANRGFQQNIYWTSSEQGTIPSNNTIYKIWAQTFSTGIQTADFLIDSAVYVRPVRSF